ncbi:MAG: hypothetical protein EP297_05145 [Gammaproteobacteria bacterium]|nr:MAG: hypothetical protein EP297_05145 [Gammaproteobacteria bacterium]
METQQNDRIWYLTTFPEIALSHMSNKSSDYIDKFDTSVAQTFYPLLCQEEQHAIRDLALEYRITVQEIRKVTTFARDLAMWDAGSIHSWWPQLEQSVPAEISGPQRKKKLLTELERRISELRTTPTRYPAEGLPEPQRPHLKLQTKSSEKKILGWCPVASEKTLCCNLRNIDAVENCLYGCSYCTIQTFYDGNAIVDEDLAEKLQSLSLEPGRYYHITSGQSSDSLAWGDKHGVLSAQCEFARKHPDILLEFKTKSSNIAPLLKLDVPANVVCSWSLNTEIIVSNEEHFTASLEQRLDAARKVADRGIKVAFHFHPIVHYQGWDKDYPDLAQQIMSRFQPSEVLFISLGAVTFIKPVLKHLRERGETTRIHQMELEPDPHGKLSNSDAVKRELFGVMYRAFEPWHDKVFMYLCMERAEIWDQVFGKRYASNNEFEADFGQHVMSKIRQLE